MGLSQSPRLSTTVPFELSGYISNKIGIVVVTDTFFHALIFRLPPIILFIGAKKTRALRSNRLADLLPDPQLWPPNFDILGHAGNPIVGAALRLHLPNLLVE